MASSALGQAYAGAGLATAARLRYDPTTNIVAREIFPENFNVTSMALPLASLGLLALTHFAVAALVMPRWLRFPMLMLYAVAMLGMAGAETWLAWHVRRDVDQYIAEFRNTFDTVLFHLQFYLEIISYMHEFAWRIKSILWEVQANTPKNIDVAQNAIVYFIGFQTAAGVLALLAAGTGLLRARAEPPCY